MSKILTIASALAVLTFSAPVSAEEPLRQGPVRVSIFENVPEEQSLSPSGEPTSRYTEAAMAFVQIPAVFSLNGLPLDRSTPFTLHAEFKRELPAGEYRFRLRSKGLAAFSIDGAPLLHTPAVSYNLNFLNGTGWDVHQDGILKQHLLIQDLDKSLAALIDDLERNKLTRAQQAA